MFCICSTEKYLKRSFILKCFKTYSKGDNFKSLLFSNSSRSFKALSVIHHKNSAYFNAQLPVLLRCSSNGYVSKIPAFKTSFSTKSFTDDVQLTSHEVKVKNFLQKYSTKYQEHEAKSQDYNKVKLQEIIDEVSCFVEYFFTRIEEYF